MDQMKLYDGTEKYTDIQVQQNKGYYSSVFTETVQARGRDNDWKNMPETLLSITMQLVK
jgi:hypothetical protein